MYGSEEPRLFNYNFPTIQYWEMEYIYEHPKIHLSSNVRNPDYPFYPLHH